MLDVHTDAIHSTFANRYAQIAEFSGPDPASSAEHQFRISIDETSQAAIHIINDF